LFSALSYYGFERPVLHWSKSMIRGRIKGENLANRRT